MARTPKLHPFTLTADTDAYLWHATARRLDQYDQLPAGTTVKVEEHEPWPADLGTPPPHAYVLTPDGFRYQVDQRDLEAQGFRWAGHGDA